MTEAADPDELEQGNSSTSTTKSSSKVTPSSHPKEVTSKAPTATNNKPPLPPLNDVDGKPSGSAAAPSSSLNDLQQDDTLELEDMCILPGDYKEPAGGAEQDVWEMLHKMMSDEAESLDFDDCKQMSSSSSRMVRPHADSSVAGPSSEHKMMQPTLRPNGGSVPEGIHFDISECRLQIHMLQEEVLHLRQFSMALIKERGELATQLLRRDEELGDRRYTRTCCGQRDAMSGNLRLRTAELESELGKVKVIHQVIEGDVASDPRSSCWVAAGGRG